MAAFKKAVVTYASLVDAFQVAAEKYGWSRDQGSDTEAARDKRARDKAKKNLLDFAAEKAAKSSSPNAGDFNISIPSVNGFITLQLRMVGHISPADLLAHCLCDLTEEAASYLMAFAEKHRLKTELLWASGIRVLNQRIPAKAKPASTGLRQDGMLRTAVTGRKTP